MFSPLKRISYLANTWLLFLFLIFFFKKWHSFLLWVWVWVASRNAFLLRSPARHRAGNRKSQQFAFFHQWGPRLSASATAPCGPSPGRIPWRACSFPWWSTPGGGLPAETHLASASLGRHSQPPGTVASSSALTYLLQQFHDKGPGLGFAACDIRTQGLIINMWLFMLII